MSSASVTFFIYFFQFYLKKRKKEKIMKLFKNFPSNLNTPLWSIVYFRVLMLFHRYLFFNKRWMKRFSIVKKKTPTTVKVHHLPARDSMLSLFFPLKTKLLTFFFHFKKALSTWNFVLKITKSVWLFHIFPLPSFCWIKNLNSVEF